MAETIKGLNIKLGLDSTELTASLSKLKGELKEQQNDLRAINAKLKYDSSNVDLWRQKQNTLNETLKTTKARLEAQNAKLEEAKKAVQVGAISQDQFNKVRRSVEYTEADISKLNKELENTHKKITALGDVKWDNLAKVGSNLTRHLTMPIVAATTALSALTVSSMNAADEIGDNASKVYLSAEAYQEWAYACEILAVDTNQLQKAFVKVNALLGDIANGDIDLVNDKLALVVLTAEDLAGLNTEQAFDKLRNALALVGDEAKRTAVANEIFGDKLGAELTQVLSATTEQINELKDTARELGIVSNEDAEIAGAFTDKISDLKQAFSSLKFELAKGFLPVLDTVISKVTHSVIPAIKKWIDAWNALSSSTKEFIGIGVMVLASIGPILVIVGKVVPLIFKLKDAFTAVSGAVQIAGASIKLSTLGFGALIAVLAVVLLQNEKFKELLKKLMDMIGQVASKLMEFVFQIVDALMPVLEELMRLFNVIIDVLVELIEKLLVPLQKIIDVIMSLIQKLIPVIIKIVNAIGDLLVPIIDLILVLLDPIVDILDIVINLISEIVTVVVALINSTLDPLLVVINLIIDVLGVVIKLVSKVVQVITSILKPVLKVVAALLEPIFKILEVIIDVISGLMDTLGPLLDIFLLPLTIKLQLLSTILEVFEPLLEGIANVIKTVIEPVLNVIFSLLKPLLDVINAIIDAIKWVFDNISNILGNVSESIGSFAIGAVDAIGNAFDWIADKVGGVFSWIGDKFSGFTSWIKELGSGIGDFFGGIVDNVSSWVNDKVDAVADWFSNTWDSVSNWFGDTAKKVGGFFGKIGSSIGNWFSDTFNLGGGGKLSTTNNNTSSQTTNHVTINTTSSEFDVDSVNRALGGAYL